MKCMICASDCHYYFSKEYTVPPFDELMKNVGKVDYYRCGHCGFVQSKTHQEMPKDEWDRLNKEHHHYVENDANHGNINQPPYIDQALSLAILAKNGIVDSGSMLDYAAGYGTLSKILDDYFGIVLPIYDRYVHAPESSRYVAQSDLGQYSVVLNSAMFEHVLSRQDLDDVNDLVKPDGALIFHTVVCENVPKDPNWFYLDPPVHTAFHTNKSMEILMRQWGYRSSIYSPRSKSWVLLRDDISVVADKLENINASLQTPLFCWKNGFVDYWKGF